MKARFSVVLCLSVAAVVLMISACGPLSSSLTPQPAPAEPPTPLSRLASITDFYCPTENEQAQQYFNTAVDLADQGQLDNAKELYLKALDLDPNYCDAMDNLGQILRRQGSVEEAIRWYKKSIELYPNNEVAHLNLAVAYGAQGKTDEARSEYEQLVQINPDNPEGYFGLGLIYLRLDQPRQAITQFEKAEELYAKQSSPLITDARYMLGGSYYMLEEWTKARDYFEMVYPEMQDNADINLFLGICYLSPELKDLDQAKKYLNKAQELGAEIPPDVQQEINK